jgi:gamma-D-glutamyl-L-lysine dipeptidyl-peptidase
MNSAISFLSVIPMRKEPSHRSEMVSQILFGEFVEKMEVEENFVHVKCLYDDYTGWIQANQLTAAEQIMSTQVYCGNWSHEILINGRTIHISMGSPLYNIKDPVIHIGKNEVRNVYTDNSFHWNIAEKSFTKSNLEYVYQKYLDTPYLWGGKSVFGIDCSGFVQRVYKMFGIKLLRDAYLQAEQGVPIQDLAQTKLGDLAFFKNENGRIIHVGILLENHQIVHASGNVRIDRIDENGIINSETGRRTHQLCLIRRMV